MLLRHRISHVFWKGLRSPLRELAFSSKNLQKFVSSVLKINVSVLFVEIRDFSINSINSVLWQKFLYQLLALFNHLCFLKFRDDFLFLFDRFKQNSLYLLLSFWLVFELKLRKSDFFRLFFDFELRLVWFQWCVKPLKQSFVKTLLLRSCVFRRLAPLLITL